MIQRTEEPAEKRSTLSNARDGRWWAEENPSRRAKMIGDTAASVWRAQEASRSAMVRAARLYGNMPILGLSPSLYRQRNLAKTNNKLSLNVVKSVTDSYVAMMTKDRPKVSFVTSGGDWKLQQRAKKCEKFVDGMFYDADLYETAPQCVYDSALFTFGCAKVYEDDDTEDGEPRIAIERIFPWEMLIEEQEAAYGKPQTMFQAKYVDRLALMEANPELASALRTANTAGFEEGGGSEGSESFGDPDTVDLVVVVEAWRLPSRSTKGRHTIVCGDVEIFDEEWKRHEFPFEFLYRNKPMIGVWGISLATELEGIQREINRLLQRIQIAMQLCASGHWLVESNSKINTNHLDNQIGGIIRYSGIPPQFWPGGTLPPEVYSHLDRLYGRAFEIVGISQLAAQAQKPAGLNSGKALLAYADIQSQRFQPAYREYQHWYLRLARHVIARAREISERKPNFGVKAASRSTMQTIRWADVHLREEEYFLKLYPTNALADDPSARMQQVQDMASAGWIDPDDAKRLLDFPDLETFSATANAWYDAVNGAVEKMLSPEHEYVPPEPTTNLAKAIPLVRDLYMKARNDGADDEGLELLLVWIEQAEDMVPAPPAAPPPPPGPGPQAPAPPPGPPPPAMPQAA